MAKKKGQPMNFKAGDRVRIINNTTGHNIALDTQFIVRGYNGQFVQMKENALNFYEIDLELVPHTLDEAEAHFQRMEKEYLIAKSKVEYMNETGVDILIEEEFRKHCLSRILAMDLSNDEKTKRIEAIYGRVA